MMRAVILGCGSSGGVPRLGGHWGACDPGNPLNRRRRCSLLVERTSATGTTRILIDTGPDMVPQLTDAGVGTLDAVVWTHPHADHIHGIDDLRQIVQNRRALLPGWADAPTADGLRQRFGYIFETPEGSDYPPVVDLNLIDGPFDVTGAGGTVSFTPFTVSHGNIPALGFRIEAQGRSIVYLPDVKDIPEAAWPAITDADVFICDALRRTLHPSHAHLDLALKWMDLAKPHRGIITNMHIDLDYATLTAELPPHIRPAHDGMVIAL